MKAYFDTSIVVTLTLQEKRWPVLIEWIVQTMPRPYFSDFGWGEYVSAIGLKVRRGEINDGDAQEIVAGIADYLRSWSRLRVPRTHLHRASLMVQEFRLGLRFPDAIHIATALANQCVLITADENQLVAARHFGGEAINPFH